MTEDNYATKCSVCKSDAVVRIGLGTRLYKCYSCDAEMIPRFTLAN